VVAVMMLCNSPAPVSYFKCLRIFICKLNNIVLSQTLIFLKAALPIYYGSTSMPNGTYGFALVLLGHICTCDLEVPFDFVDTNAMCGAFGFLISS